MGENAYILSHTSYGPKMENELVCRIVLRWLFECYDPPDIAPARVEGAEFDPQFIWREQWQRLLEALHPPPRPPAPRPPCSARTRPACPALTALAPTILSSLCPCCLRYTPFCATLCAVTGYLRVLRLANPMGSHPMMDLGLESPACSQHTSPRMLLHAMLPGPDRHWGSH